MLYTPKEFKVVSLRECPPSDKMKLCKEPQDAADYWNQNIKSSPAFNSDVETLAVLLLTARQKIRGHAIIATGILNEVYFHPREVLRPAVVMPAHSILLMHNHPSGDPSPSQADIKLTRNLFKAAKIFLIPLHDHVIVGGEKYASLRELGYLC